MTAQLGTSIPLEATPGTDAHIQISKSGNETPTDGDTA